MRYLLLLLFIFIAQHLYAQTSPAYKDTVFTEHFRRTSGWTASDATISVPLPDYKSLWLFGDTYIDNVNEADTTLPCLFQVRNSMLVQDMRNPSALVTILDNTQTGVDRTPIKAQDNHASYFWPGHGYVKEDTAIVFWQRYMGEDYTHMGNYISTIYTPGFSDASNIASLTALDLPVALEFGVSVVVDSADQYLYIYGHVKDWIILRPLVARCPMNQNILDTQHWEFYDGAAWVSDANAAEQILASTGDYVSPSYSVIKLQGKYYMISQENGFLTCGLGREIYSWESNNPYGPFTNKKVLYTIEDNYKGEYWVTYNATAHPEFIENNELLISYNVNGFDNDATTSCENECQDAFTDRRHADGYRPKFIRVPLTYIDPALNIADPVFPDDGDDDTITGINVGHSEEINLYPNPSQTGSFSIAGNFDPNEKIKVFVRDLQGQLIQEATFEGEPHTVELKNNGVFFVQVTTRNKNKVLKLIIK